MALLAKRKKMILQTREAKNSMNQPLSGLMKSIQPGRDLITDPLGETCTCKCKMGLNARAALPYYCKNVS